MPALKQIAFMAEDSLSKEITELAEKVQRSKSDVLNALIWGDIQRLKANPPANFGELMQTSAGTAMVIDSNMLAEIFVKNPSLLTDVQTLIAERLSQKKVEQK